MDRQLSPHVIVLFGAVGDLAQRKLLPGLLRLYRAGLLPECRIVGTSLEELDDHGFRDVARIACGEHVKDPIDDATWDRVLGPVAVRAEQRRARRTARRGDRRRAGAARTTLGRCAVCTT